MATRPSLTSLFAAFSAVLVWGAACDSSPGGAAVGDTRGDTSDTADSDAVAETVADTQGDLGSETTPGAISLAFAVTVPDETPLGATVIVELGGGASAPLTQGADGIYRGSADVADHAQLSWHVAMTAPLAVAEVAATPRQLTVTRAETLSATVDHWAGVSAGAEVAFVVTAPDTTPSDAHLYISGNQPTLGDWDGAGLELVRVQHGRWGQMIEFPEGTDLAFKATRGSWDNVEKTASGAEVDNRAANAGAAFQRVAFGVAAWRDLLPTAPGDLGPSSIDFINGVTSNYLAPSRDIIVYLPPGYADQPAHRYPVLYMHDGQNLMDPETSAFGTDWGVDEAADDAIHAGEVEPLIVVGVYNTSDRMTEYTESYDSDEQTGGDADNYGAFLVSELKPRIDQAYRTRADQASTGVAGSSLGGLVSMYFGFTSSDTFSRIGVVSPSVWWDNLDIVDRANALPAKLPLKVWLDIGLGEPQSAVTNARKLRDALIGKGWALGQDLAYGEYANAGHNEAAWAARMGDILRWLYPAP